MLTLMKRDVLVEKIRAAGFRATKPRVALLTFLSRAKFPLHAQEIVSRLKGTDQVTVYRMLDAFTRAHLVREVNLKGERPRYELEDTEHDHHHIVCVGCHKMEDFYDCGGEQLGKKVLRQSRSFAKITGHSFDLYGVCKECAK